MGRMRWWLGPLGTLAMLAAACGGGGAPAGTQPDATAATQPETTAPAGEPVRAAWVYVGPIGDAGWTWAHDQGRLHVEEELGDGVETTFLESVPEGAESQRVFEDLDADGWQVIFGTSFGYMDPMLAAAQSFPDTIFEHATGFKTADNMGTYFGAAEEGRYLTGLVAGEMTESGEIGYVAAFPIPEVLRGINAFTLGVRESDPEARVQVVWTSTWYDPAKERQAAESLLDAGADVLAMHQDSPATGEAAQEGGAYWVGYNSDMERFAPDAWLTAPAWDWGPFYLETVEAVRDGTWAPDQYYGDMASGMVDVAPFGAAVPEDLRRRVEQRKQEVIDGSFEIFTGPIVDQDGNVVVPEGEVASLEHLLSTDYLVEGVIGEIPAG